MGKKKKLSPGVIEACEVLLSNGAGKNHLAKALDMSTQTFNKRLQEHHFNLLEDEVINLRVENSLLKEQSASNAHITVMKHKRQA